MPANFYPRNRVVSLIPTRDEVALKFEYPSLMPRHHERRAPPPSRGALCALLMMLVTMSQPNPTAFSLSKPLSRLLGSEFTFQPTLSLQQHEPTQAMTNYSPPSSLPASPFSIAASSSSSAVLSIALQPDSVKTSSFMAFLRLLAMAGPRDGHPYEVGTSNSQGIILWLADGDGLSICVQQDDDHVDPDIIAFPSLVMHRLDPFGNTRTDARWPWEEATPVLLHILSALMDIAGDDRISDDDRLFRMTDDARRRVERFIETAGTAATSTSTTTHASSVGSWWQTLLNSMGRSGQQQHVPPGILAAA